MSELKPLLAGQPADGDEPVFREPWEAQAFALAVHLNGAGLFTWDEWAARLSQAITAAQGKGDPDLGDTYYHHWLAALETLITEKTGSDEGRITEWVEAWRQAYLATPHGDAIQPPPPPA